MDFTFSELTQWLGLLWWPFIRITGFFLIAPFFGDQSLPAEVRILLSLAFTLLCAPLIGEVPAVNPFSVGAVLLTLTQLAYGAMLGFALLIFFTIYTMAGQAISMQLGLAMAVMNDPSSGVSVAIIGRFFQILCSLLFLAFDGHLVVLALFKESFVVFPIDMVMPYESFDHILKMVGWMFSAALMLAIPAICVMQISQVTFGFMNKAAPSFNVFALGFPMTMTIGLFALGLSFTGVGDSYLDNVLQMLDHFRLLMENQ